jgi:hypothetical protein
MQHGVACLRMRSPHGADKADRLMIVNIDEVAANLSALYPGCEVSSWATMQHGAACLPIRSPHGANKADRRMIMDINEVAANLSAAHPVCEVSSWAAMPHIALLCLPMIFSLLQLACALQMCLGQQCALVPCAAPLADGCNCQLARCSVP